MEDNSLEARVWQTVQRLNRAWVQTKDVSALREFFHQDMVAISPTDRHRREGRESCMQGWGEFVQAFEVLSWEELHPKIQLYAGGKTAIVTYEYTMQCRRGEKEVRFDGRDMMVLVEEQGRWWLVADQFSPFPEGTSS